MSEEIKEINRIIQSISDFYKMDNALKYYLDRRKANILLDYITNLQQKAEQLEKENNKLIELEFLRTKTTLDIINERDEHFAKGIKLEKKLIELENIRKETIKYILKNKLYRFKYDDEELFEITTDKKAKDDLLNILNKGE